MIESALFSISEVFISPNKYSLRYKQHRVSLSDRRIHLSLLEDRIELTVNRGREGVEFVTIPRYRQTLFSFCSITPRIRAIESSLAPQFEISHATLESNRGKVRHLEIITQRLEAGELLSSAIERGGVAPHNLSRAIALLERTLRELRIGFERLTPESIILGLDGRLYPIRCDEIFFSRQSSSCDELRRMCGVEGMEELEPLESYPRRFVESGRFLYKAPLREDRAAIQENSGWGFVDGEDSIIVEPHYLYVSNFTEGRAIVQSHQGWGLIDPYGREVIPAIYESIGHNMESGISSVRQGDMWAYFSYRGEPMTPFCITTPDEDISLQEVMSLECAYPGVGGYTLSESHERVELHSL